MELLIILGLVTMGHALEVNPLQYGVADENIGEGRVFREAAEIVAVQNHPKVMR